MTPDEFNEETAGSNERLLDSMVAAKFATYRTDRVPPLLEAIRLDGSTLQVYAPSPYVTDQEFDVLGSLLRVARAWMPDHTVIGFDTARVVDYERAPAQDNRTEETLWEMSRDWDGAAQVILVHGYNGRDGATAELVDYIFNDEGEVGINQARLALDMTWLSWSVIASNMERFLLPGLAGLEDQSFDEIAAEAHARGYAIFAIQQGEGPILIQAWGDTYLELALKPGLSREQIEEDIAEVFALTRAASAGAEEHES